MAGRTVSVKLTAEVAGYIQGMKNAAAATKDLASSSAETAQKHKKAFTEAGIAIGAIGAVAAAGVALAVKSFADFDAAMSGVQAATHASAGEMLSLRDAALEAGARTVFSAAEAADAIEQLAKAGVSTRDILNGGLNGALDLAAAGSLDVGQAAEIAATALTQFRLKGTQVPHVADLLAAAAGKAQGEVSDMGAALRQSGLVASQTGLSIEETTGALAAFAKAGLIGSDAGTSLKTMLQRLTPQSAEAQKEMDRLGISAYDAQGNFVGLEKFAGNLQGAMKGLSTEQRQAAMSTIFGSDAVRAASVLYEQGADGVKTWIANVNDAGYAQETASIKLNNLKGDVEAFSGSVETAMIRTGQVGDGVARQTVQAATAIVNAYNELPAAAQGVTLGLGGFVAAAGSASGALLLLLPRIQDTREALRTLRTEAPRTAGAISGLGKAAGIAGVVLATATAWDALTNALARSRANAAPAAGALTKSLADFARTGEATGALTEAMSGSFGDFAHALDLAGRNGNALVAGFRNSGRITEAKNDIEALDKALAGMVAGGHSDQAAQAFAYLADVAGKGGVSIDVLRQRMPEYVDAVAAAQAETSLAADSQDNLSGAMDQAAGSAKSQEEALRDLIDGIRSLSDQVLGLRGSERDFEAALDAATTSVKENGRTLDITTEKGRANSEALDRIAGSANDVAEAMLNSGQPLDVVRAKVDQQRDALFKAARQFGMTEQDAHAYVDEVLRVPASVTTNVSINGADTAATKARQLRDELASIPSFKNVTVSYSQVGGYAVGSGGGGKQLERAAGGWVSGPGTATSDSISARLSNGEFVVNAAAASRHGQLLEAINGKRFADGGWVSGRFSGVTSTLPGTVVLRVGDREFTAYVDERAAGQVVAGANTRSAGGWV